MRKAPPGFPEALADRSFSRHPAGCSAYQRFLLLDRREYQIPQLIQHDY